MDFKLVKTSKGGYADYSTSKWSRRERPLSEAELEAIKTHSLFNLTDFVPKKPTDVELKVMQEMFAASVDGEAFDKDAWGQYFRPAGMSSATGDPIKAGAAPADDGVDPEEAPVVKAAPAAAPAAAKETSSSKADDILAMIRNRQKQ